MKRDVIVRLLASEIRSRNTGHYSYNETAHASDVLKVLESLGLINPKHKVMITRMCMMGTPYEEEIEVDGWDKSND